MIDFFTAVFFFMLAGSIWGAVVLARKWAASFGARFFLSIALTVVFWIVGTFAVVAGCSGLGGAMDFR